MGFLSETERASLRIREMSLHVVGTDDFVEQPKRDNIEHEEFFIERIRGNDMDSVYSFEEHSAVRDVIARIAAGDDFEKGAQDLARDFSRLHVGTSKEGAFFVFDLDTDDDSRIFCLIKYDYHEAIEQRQEGGKSVLRQIIHAFVKEKRAVQKCCLVRVKGGKVELAVSARDRVKPSPELSDYFYKYLGVQRTRDDAELTRAVVDVVRNALTECKEYLPNQQVGPALQRAKSALRLRQEVTAAAISEIVIGVSDRSEDEKAVLAMQHSVTKQLAKARLEGVHFKPSLVVSTPPRFQ